jgi:hypothetical protein
MVYGPKAPGNFARLTKMVRMGIPLPLGSINKKDTLSLKKNGFPDIGRAWKEVNRALMSLRLR